MDDDDDNDNDIDDDDDDDDDNCYCCFFFLVMLGLKLAECTVRSWMSVRSLQVKSKPKTKRLEDGHMNGRNMSTVAVK